MEIQSKEVFDLLGFIVNQILRDTNSFKNLQEKNDIQQQLLDSYNRFNPGQQLAVNEIFTTLTGYSFEAFRSKVI